MAKTLCSNCRGVCEPRGTREGIRYLEFKKEALDHLKSDPTFSELPQLQDLEADLRAFRSALRFMGSDSQIPCPWYMGDLAWLPSEPGMNEVVVDMWGPETDIRDVVSSSSMGCELCLKLCAIFLEITSLGDPSQLLLESWIVLHPISLKPKLLRVLVQGTNLDHVWIELRVEFQSWQTAMQLEFKTPKGSSTNDSSCFDFVTQSFRTCVSTHSTCQQASRSGWVPTRLIDVSPSSTENNWVRLVERNDLKTSGVTNPQYLTLSHVWGSEKFLTLTQQSIASFRTRLELSSLRQSFQDAILVARHLQVRYLWVDSLCIFQDSLDDWRVEASLMNMVYANCLCNLAACNEGLFRSRNPVIGGSAWLTWKWSNYIVTLSVIYDWFHTVANHVPLSTRGWVLQEMLLSPRTIHFSTFLVWECREMVTSEAYPTEDYGVEYEWLAGSQKLDLAAIENAKDAESFWNGVIYRYSRCKLTVESDKLTALCGIAKELAALQQGQYLAGMWSQTLLKDLLWQIPKWITGNDVGNLRSVQYVAPSWSWASIVGPVDPFTGMISHSLADILSATTTSANQDQFKEVVAGELRLRCVMYKVPKLRDMIKDKERYLDTLEYDARGFSVDDCGWQFLDTETDETYFLPLVESPDASLKDNLQICGLLVERDSSYEQQPTFQRIGFAAVTDDGDIANSGWVCQDWISPPWPDRMAQVVTIV